MGELGDSARHLPCRLQRAVRVEIAVAYQQLHHIVTDDFVQHADDNPGGVHPRG